MQRRLGYLWLFVAVGTAVVAGVIGVTRPFQGTVPGTTLSLNAGLYKALVVVTVVAAASGLYTLTLWALTRTASKRRAHNVRNVLRLLFGAVAVAAVLGALTEQWLGVLFSLGVVGFAITFALQQPLLSLLGWVYIMVKRPYNVGDRVKIENSKGDVIEVDFLVTTLWEINGDLVTTHQPSGRVVSVPNSVVLSAQVVNYSTLVEHVWNELSVQVAYESDLEFVTSVMTEEADDFLGDEMAHYVGRYREELSETPVELEVQDRPAVNVVQEETWVELRLRYLVHPRRGTRTRNELYRRILARLNEHPERVRFPLGRNR